MRATDYAALIAASPGDRLDAFLTTANRLGAPVGNIEKDFWVCWTLEALYHQLPGGQPRLLFKGGTSLSKAYGLIERFSEDIDVTVFRDDHRRCCVRRRTRSAFEQEAPREARRHPRRVPSVCHGPTPNSLAALVADATSGAGRIEIDDADPDRQTLLIHYPEVEPRDGAYVRPVVRIESGAKSAIDPNEPTIIRPYVTDDLPGLDLVVPDVTTIKAARTFWDKVVIAHGLRRWYDRRDVLRQEGQRISRHYYDLHCLAKSNAGEQAMADPALGEDCVSHARIFFDRPDYDLATAVPGSYALTPHDTMIDALRRDYDNTRAMIFGYPPTFANILASVAKIEERINADAGA